MKRVMTAAVAALMFAAGGSAVIGAENALPAPGKEFKDCAECPTMVVLPPGSFAMGTAAGEEDREAMAQGTMRDRSVPQHRVVIPRAFAVGKYEVTRDEYARFVLETKRADPEKCTTIVDDETFKLAQASGKAFPQENRINAGAPLAEINANWRDPGFVQMGRDPVACIDFNEAKAYVQWLSQKTGKAYRLLTEAEWEYAARAGTTTARWWGESAAGICSWANGADLTAKAAYPTMKAADCRDRYVHTAPVDAFKPNAFGVHIVGNVWEWVEDCWTGNYDGAPADGSARMTGDCAQRVLRGGSWFNDPSLLRAAVRRRSHVESRIGLDGFRVARSN